MGHVEAMGEGDGDGRARRGNKKSGRRGRVCPAYLRGGDKGTAARETRGADEGDESEAECDGEDNGRRRRRWSPGRPALIYLQYSVFAWVGNFSGAAGALTAPSLLLVCLGCVHVTAPRSGQSRRRWLGAAASLAWVLEAFLLETAAWARAC